ncbi:MAG: 1,4-dihydroxy-2-naphthoate polyprenyltransferase [Chitinophagales bacterium]
MATLQHWLSAFRLRTLPLALSCIGLGSFLAAAQNQFVATIFWLSALTTVFLQILSNLANDYGDSVHGADSVDRSGPQRAVQSGAISKQSMFRAMVLFSLLALGSGLVLIYFAVQTQFDFFIFLGLGVLSIIAAITYTAGKKPYGYAGLGDISVLIFFGWVGVLGTYYLHTHQIQWDLLLPASTCGLFAVAVLNVNNIRDIESDKKAGKHSVPVRIGRANAVKYHYLLLALGLVCALAYVGLNYQSPWQFIFLIVLPLLYKNAQAVQQKTAAAQLDPYLKQMAMTTLLFVLSFGIGQLL